MVLNAYWGLAAPLVTREFGGQVEKFIGDGIVVLFNSRGDQRIQMQFSAHELQHLQGPLLRHGMRRHHLAGQRIGGFPQARL